MEFIVNALKQQESVKVTGLQGSATAYVLSKVLHLTRETLVVIVGDAQRAEFLAGDLAFYANGDLEIRLLPSWEILPFERASPYVSLQCRRIQILRRLSTQHPPRVIVVPLEAFMQRMPPRSWIKEQSLLLHEAMEIPMDRVGLFLEGRGYKRVPLVEEPGDYSVRGGILDCFSPNMEMPTRVEFVGNEVESIRAFAADTQRSSSRQEAVEILPVREIPWRSDERYKALQRLERRLKGHTDSGLTELLENVSEGIHFPGMEFLLPLFHESLDTLVQYLPENCTVVIDEPDALMEGAKLLWERASSRSQTTGLTLAHILSTEELYIPPDAILNAFGTRKRLTFSALNIHRPGENEKTIEVQTQSNSEVRLELSRDAQGDALEGLARKFRQWLDGGFSVHWLVRSPTDAVRLKEHLDASGLTCRLKDPSSESVPSSTSPSVWLHVGELSQGFTSPQLGLVVLTEEEIFGPRRLQRPHRYARKLPSISHIEDLQDGDLVVHVDHGIGIYRGLRTLEIGDLRGDFLQLEYMGNDRLYVPVNRFQSVHKYMGSEGDLPRLDRLGGGAWERRKKSVKKAVRRMAKELLQLYASREVTQGHAFSSPDDLYKEFVQGFPYDETPDQSRAIEEVMTDMSAPRPMERLVCGDVGFGKTEVAMRAAFRAVMDGKQVAYLVPTTILAEQHYATFLERFRAYPIFVEALSRFRSSSEQRKILKKCADGTIDILIGTHRLLQRDVGFKDIGLLIIDEEHRFGVAHKERFKKIRKEVDILILTATPIPRTLHMAFLGIRDLSVIETPPPERLSIRTIIAAFEQSLVAEAVQREMARGGQVFFVHNRVRGIDRIAGTLRKWLPGVRIAIAHGQMPSSELAEVMERFHRKEIDLLVCTTIIQSGLDIPTANTILIYRAHRLGLAEMYQIRGRVGRAGHQAYAYLLLPENEDLLTKEAVSRLQTLQQFTELGSGFRIASRDLEIRGAGTLLGPSQSGHIEAVGFEMYTQLMRRAIAEIKNEPLTPDVEPEIHLPVHAYLPEEYIPDAHQRMAVYRRLSRVESEEEIAPIGEEILDRFGPIPQEGENLLHLMGLRCLLKVLGIQELRARDGAIQVTFHPTTPVSPQGLVRLVESRPESGIRFLSEDTVELPLSIEGEKPISLIAQKALKGAFGGVSIDA